MRISRERLLDEAGRTGFRPDTFEKVVRILGLLGAFRSHPYLRDRLVLKGGTALNLFCLDTPRLSVDIDLNYVGAVERARMIEERAPVDQAVRAVCAREDFEVRRAPDDEHAGGKWFLRYESALGQRGNLEIDINFMFRVQLWQASAMDSRPLGSYQARDICVQDIHELAAGKLAALMSRGTPRDLFDVREIFRFGGFDHAGLRIAFIVYGAMNRKDWRSISPDDITIDIGAVQSQLIPLLPAAVAGDREAAASLGAELREACRRALSVVFPFSESEANFLDAILERGEIEPALLTPDKDLQSRIKAHPMLEWKARNVRSFKGID
ncbi:MAG: nucleotidyl transferase AbiEii/AbiGii toxin family protein [Candidatus Krumholzibacteria bacterium]|nr:nucleotidyl transferase AbiEii/AbiGii toxin family protein [Candidatus Krumholzibacteria bacterium]